MKSCPTCNRTFEDTLTFCLVDGAILSAPYDPQATLIVPAPRNTNPPPTKVLLSSNIQKNNDLAPGLDPLRMSPAQPLQEVKQKKSYLRIGLFITLALVVSGFLAGLVQQIVRIMTGLEIVIIFISLGIITFITLTILIPKKAKK